MMPQRSRVWQMLSAQAVALAALFAFQGNAFTADRPTGPVTFTKDVAPIIQQKCQMCHRPGSVAPMVFMTYEHVRPWALPIKDRVTKRLMPPWHVDKTVGVIQEFQGDLSLSDEQIETIVAWVDAGAPLGNPSDMPAPINWPDFTSSWRLEAEYKRPPDLIVRTQPYTVVANGLDQWFDSNVEVKGLTEPRWIRAVESRPATTETASVFHHLASSLVGRDGERSGLQGGALGKTVDIFPSDSGKLIEPGSRVESDMHFFPVGREVKDAVVEIAIWFYDKGVTPRFETRGEVAFLSDAGGGMPRGGDLFIPPHGTQMMRGVHVLKRPTRIHSIRGHMHLRGKAQAVEAIYPDGRREILSRINWQHNWHNTYIFAEHVQPLLPTGTVLIVTSWFDNTAQNRHNPDPDQFVVFGRRTVDEMSHLWLGLTEFDQDDFQELIAERKALLTSRATAAARTTAGR